MKMKKHELDKSTVEGLPPFTKEELEEVKEDLSKFIQEEGKATHFMLLSNDINYYTIFQRLSVSSVKGSTNEIFSFLTEDSFLQTLGELKVLKRTDNGDIEIWIGSTYFLLFDASSFIVKV